MRSFPVVASIETADRSNENDIAPANTTTNSYMLASFSVSLHREVINMNHVLLAVAWTITLYTSCVGVSASVIEPPFVVGSRSILRSIDGGKTEERDYAVELNATNFDAVLKETPASYAIVEFYAHWCPACRNYKPQYEKVAKLFNGGDAVHPGIILMTRVDCASKVNTNLCEKFSIGHYPMLLWGMPSKFSYGSWDPKQDKNEIRLIDDGRTADRLLSWINKQTNSSYGLEDKKYEKDYLHTNMSDPGQIARAIYDVEEATYTAFDIILEQKMIKSETRASLVKFLQLLVVHHPSRRCRKGTAEILVDFDDIYLNKKENSGADEMGTLRNYHICGKDVPRGYWVFCRGSKKETRGFSCGLWVLLHSLSVRVDDGETHVAFTTICDFIHNFFICQECRQHFYGMCSSVKDPFKKARDLVLWLWNAHNQVNERLMKEESSLKTDDPKFPKVIWPPRQICSSCYLSEDRKYDGSSHINWDHDGVYKFLIGHYGDTLGSLYKDKEHITDKRADGVVAEDVLASANAVVVPVGAALAIAMASCAFGALACYWRQKQKNRKPRRSWN